MLFLNNFWTVAKNQIFYDKSNVKEALYTLISKKFFALFFGILIITFTSTFIFAAEDEANFVEEETYFAEEEIHSEVPQHYEIVPYNPRAENTSDSGQADSGLGCIPLKKDIPINFFLNFGEFSERSNPSGSRYDLVYDFLRNEIINYPTAGEVEGGNFGRVNISYGSYRLIFYFPSTSDDFLLDCPINIGAFDATVDESVWQKFMENTIKKVKSKNPNGYIMFLALNFRKLRENNNETEVKRISDRMNNYVCDYLQRHFIPKLLNHTRSYREEQEDTKIVKVDTNFDVNRFFDKIVEFYSEYKECTPKCLLL